jgi:stearoyl-CoA desaturase (Delta-9 desaturase)
LFTSLFLPTFIPCFFFGESFWTAYYAHFLRLIISWHITWTVNSFAHITFPWLGSQKPYDKNISANDSYFVGLLAGGEGENVRN